MPTLRRVAGFALLLAAACGTSTNTETSATSAPKPNRTPPSSFTGGVESSQAMALDSSVPWWSGPEPIRAAVGSRFGLALTLNFDCTLELTSDPQGIVERHPTAVGGLGFPTPLRRFATIFTARKEGSTDLTWRCTDAKNAGRVQRLKVVVGAAIPAPSGSASATATPSTSAK
jgi:hypothetical protein